MSRSASKAVLLFSAGEITPKLAARSDIEKLPNSCRTLQNMIVRRTGVATRRAGLEYIGSAKGTDPTLPVEETGSRYGFYDSGNIFFTQDGGIGDDTFWTYRWTMELQETTGGVWDWETHGYVSWTGANPPFDAGDIWINTDGNPNSGSLLSRYENQDVLFVYGTSARSGSATWADNQPFYAALQYYTPAFGFIAQHGPILLSDMID